MTRILFDARALAEHGGVSRVAGRLLAHLRATRPNDDIVTMTTGWDIQKNSDIHLKIPNKLWSLLCLLRLTSLDRVAERMTHKPFDELILPNVGFIGTPRTPYTIVVHDLSFLIEPRWFPFRMRLWHRAVRARHLIKQANRILCVSETTARDVERLLNVAKERIEILSPAIVVGTLDRHPESKPSPIAQPYLLAFDDTPRKNISTAITTVAHLRNDERFKNLSLVIVGRPVRQTKPDWIRRVSSVSDETLNNLYRNASAFLYPSWYEGFGLPLHEAAAHGIPCLASAHGALPETAPTDTILIPPNKPQLWVTTLKEILKT